MPKAPLRVAHTHTTCQPATIKIQKETPKRQERSQINLTLQPKELEKEQTKPKASGREEIVKIRAEINKTEIRKSTNPKVSSLKRPTN